MTANKSKKLIWIVVSLLFIGIGTLNIINGNPGFGTGLIVVILASLIARYFKEKRAAEIMAKGLNPNDERSYYIGGLAARTTMTISVILGVIVMLLGSIGPETLVNPYDFLGYCISFVLLVYVGAFYYYNKKY